MSVNFPTQLSTVLVNTSGAARFYPYLGKNGVTIAAGATHTMPGSLVALYSDNRVRSRRMRQLLNNDLAAGNIQIRKSQSPLMKRSNSNSVYIVDIDETGQNDVVNATRFSPST
jgi:uncharacterized protein (DUF2252 family)